MTTFPPANRKRSAMALPAPFVPPVTRTRLPLNSPVSLVDAVDAVTAGFSVALAFPRGRQRHYRLVLGRFGDWLHYPNHLGLWLLAAALLFHESPLTVIDRYVQQAFTIGLTALRYQYGIAASQIFRGHQRRGKL